MDPVNHIVQAAADAIQTLRAAYPSLPDDYYNFLAFSNGAEGELGIEPGWVVVFGAEDALTAIDNYGLAEYLPGYFAFGSNGGGDVFVMPLDRPPGNCPVMMVPAIGMSVEDLRPVSPSFADFERYIGVPFDEPE